MYDDDIDDDDDDDDDNDDDDDDDDDDVLASLNLYCIYNTSMSYILNNYMIINLVYDHDELIQF